MDTKELTDDIMKWFTNPKTMKGLAMYLGVTILLGLDFAYWAGAIETSEIGAEVIIIDGEGEGEGEEKNTTLVPQDIMDQTGAALHGSLTDRSSTIVTFDLPEGGKYLLINLSCENPREAPRATDYDMYVTDPGGKSHPAATAETYEEQLELDYRDKNKTLPSGTWEVEIVFWANTLGTNWHLVVTAEIEAEFGPEDNSTTPSENCAA
ncbi:MAG: hypothetical protein KAT70_07715 [Thermoplasmata archaeon]|nr:hypothetical protein [Thermoplasmata archaeon]